MCNRCLSSIGECPELISGNADYLPKDTHLNKLYFIAKPDLQTIKIGQSKNTYARIKILQQEEHQKLILIAQYPMPDKKTERRIHKHFDFLRIDPNREWFYYRHNICGFLKELWLTYHCGMTFITPINLFQYEPNFKLAFKNGVYDG